LPLTLKNITQKVTFVNKKNRTRVKIRCIRERRTTTCCGWDQFRKRGKREWKYQKYGKNKVSSGGKIFGRQGKRFTITAKIG